MRTRGLRLGIDLDGVVADFNAGWIKLHREEFGSELHPSMVQTWDGLAELGGFDDMRAFWAWAKGSDLRPSIFRHLEPYPTALDTLHRLRTDGHSIVVITTKPEWAVTDTFRWLADNRLPTREVHIADVKSTVECDMYLDDSPHVLPDLIENRPNATVCRFVRPWNHPLDGASDVDSWATFHALVTQRSSKS
ncbi:5' nucleotidase, NT5C type [Ilumatobacter sp.]|uniref:5' nucleotidase, NT5C type n=1 Tax=Ilumatobacter sp. TaxID=1967498 RepID=UPI003C369587